MRLIDYFAVVGYEDFEQPPITQSNNDENELQHQQHQTNNHQPQIGRAKIIQRFPLHNIKIESAEQDDATNEDQQEQEFDHNIHCFCQPHKGWRLYSKQEPPTFFVSVLTDIKGQRRYCACLTFLEPYQDKNLLKNKSASSEEDDDDIEDYEEDFDLEDDTNVKIIINRKKTRPVNLVKSKSRMPIEPSKLYSAKSLVLISRLEYIDLFKSCLSLIYACYVDKRHNSDNKLLEHIVSNLLTIQVSRSGTAQINSFSLGADDKHIVQSTASLSVPFSGTCVYKLFKELGVVNVLKLVCAIMADFKILFFSRSYTKLYDACRAIEALIYPLKYTGVYVPVLPCFGTFLEFPAAPTPYIIGVHASYRRLIEEMHSDSLHECLKVDLDGASVSIPPAVDDLICGVKPQMATNSNSNLDHNNQGGSSSSSSGITSMSSSSASSFNDAAAALSGQKESFMNMQNSHGLPHNLYESTLNLLFSILKPDVLHADEINEFSKAQERDLYVDHTKMNENDSLDHKNEPTTTTSTTVSSSSSTTTNNMTSSSSSLINQLELEQIWLDKLLRSIFVRMFAQLFAGYRYCLLLIRINPKPVICFNKASFLGNHKLVDNEFMNRLLDSMSFQKFIEERGPSYRNCDVFDDLYADILSHLQTELEQQLFDLNNHASNSSQLNSLTILHLKQIAEKLFKYEYPFTNLSKFFAHLNSNQTNNSTKNKSTSSSSSSSGSNNLSSNNGILSNQLVKENCSLKNLLISSPLRSYSKIKMPTLDAHKRLHSETFPLLNSEHVENLINAYFQEQVKISKVFLYPKY